MRDRARLVILFLLMAVSFWRNAVWQNDKTLWSDALEKSPLKARGYNELGLHAVSTGHYGEAFQALMKSLELDPYQPTVYLNLGLAYEGTKQLDKAVKMYEQSISMAADDPAAYYNLGIIYYQEYKNREKAMELFLKARDLNPIEPDVHQYLGKIYQEMGRFDIAEKEFRLFRALK